MKNRNGSYKKVLLSPQEMTPRKAYLQTNLDALFKAHLSPFELTTLYMLLFLRIKHQENWLQKTKIIPASEGKTLLDLIPESFALTNWEKEKLTGLSPLTLFSHCKLRGIPASIHRTMIHWAQDLWQIKVLTYIPSAKELLKLQVEKCRCITLIHEEKDLDQLVLNARDPLSFLLHDLMHADHFFNQENSLKGQLGFYFLVYQIYDRPELKQRLKTDKDFKKEFEYVASDMNAYSIHLFKCLKSAILKNEERLNRPFFPDLIRWWKMPERELAAAQRLNTPVFNQHDEECLRTFFENQCPVAV